MRFLVLLFLSSFWIDTFISSAPLRDYVVKHKNVEPLLHFVYCNYWFLLSRVAYLFAIVGINLRFRSSHSYILTLFLLVLTFNVSNFCFYVSTMCFIVCVKFRYKFPFGSFLLLLLISIYLYTPYSRTFLFHNICKPRVLPAISTPTTVRSTTTKISLRSIITPVCATSGQWCTGIPCCYSTLRCVLQPFSSQRLCERCPQTCREQSDCCPSYQCVSNVCVMEM